MTTFVRRRLLQLLTAASVLFAAVGAYADAVTDWNAHLEEAVYATAQPIPAQPRFAAIVHAAIFDAINGIARRYEPFFVKEWATPEANQEAAAVQAAYMTLVYLYPSQKTALDAHLAEALTKIPGHQGNSQAIARGREWGAYVAQQVLAWRSSDGFSVVLPPYFGGTGPGIWRSPPTPTNADGTLPALFPQLAVLTPFIMNSPSHFRPGPPPALSSALYASDLNEVKAIGRFDSAIRTSDQTQLALLWQAVGVINENSIARSVIPADYALVDTARLFALINFAVRLADTDGNPDTTADQAWNSLFVAPRFQEYISNHSVLTGAVMHVLARLLGDQQTFTLNSPLFPTFTWTFSRFSDAAAQVKEARIWGGIHFRTACEVGGEIGIQLGDYVIDHVLRPRQNRGIGQP
jgi:hypothetical protein